MFERFTERARRVIFFARYHASEFGTMTIESEHMLLGLAREDKNLIRRVFQDHAGDTSIRTEVEQRVVRGERVSTSVDLPLSNECKRILAYAAEEMERLNSRSIGTEHLLLGILREEKCIAAEILRQRGLKLEALRQEFARSPHVEHPEAFRKNEPMVGFSLSEYLQNPALPERGVVPDAETAKQLAEVIWKSLYPAETVAMQNPIQVELRHNVWIVTGSSRPEPLFAFIQKEDGRILSVGGAQ